MDQAGTKGLVTCKICKGRAIKTQYLIKKAKTAINTVKCLEETCGYECVTDTENLSEISKIGKSKGEIDH